MMKREIFIADVVSDSVTSAVDTIGLLFGAILTVCNHFLGAFVKLAPGAAGSYLGLGTVWLLAFGIILLGVRQVLFNQLQVKR